MSYKPNLFGSVPAMEAWEKISKILDYTGDPDFKMGDRPFLHLITKTRLKREKNKILQAISSDEQKSKDRYVLGIYSPEGLLILGFLMMEKGLPLTSGLSTFLRAAILIEQDKLKSLSGQDKRDRSTQLSHFMNILTDYEPTPEGTRIKMFGTDRNRSKKRDKRRREKKEREKLKDKAMSKEDIKNLAYTYMLLRMFHGVTETNRIFKLYAPEVNTRLLCEYIINNGLADNRCRPGMEFRNHIYTLLMDYRTS